MTGKQITLIGATLVLAASLFYSGYKTSTGKASTDEVAGAPGEFDFNEYLNEQKKELPEQVRATVAGLEKESSEKENLLNLARIWDSSGQKLISAHYCMEVAEKAPDENNWYFAGTKFYDVASAEPDSLKQVYAGKQAQHAFEKVVALNPANLDAKNALAIIHVQVNQDVMKGVGLLKEVVEKDSNNLQAIFTLGMLSVRSGQLDKARQRFEKLVKLQPFNAEYYFYLGETYAKLGEKQKAIKTYQTCQTLLKDDKARKEVQTIINQLNTL